MKGETPSIHFVLDVQLPTYYRMRSVSLPAAKNAYWFSDCIYIYFGFLLTFSEKIEVEEGRGLINTFEIAYCEARSVNGNR